MNQPAARFHVGQRVVCVDASPNRKCAVMPLKRGKIYIVRAIALAPGWKSPKPE